MRVVINGWFSGRAVGSGRYTDELLAALRQTAPDDTFEAVTARHPGPTWRKLAFEQLHFPRRARGADVAHVPYWAPPLRCTVPTVVTVHDLIPLVLPEYRRGVDARLYLELVVRASRRAAAILADSRHTAADAVRLLGIPAERVHVVPLGVGPPYGPLPAGTGSAEGHGFALRLPERYGLYLGGFDPRKNLATLFRAWRCVHAATGVPLVVAGGVPPPGARLGEPPQQTARRVGLPDEALVITGTVAAADLPELYRRASVFAYPSHYEGFGLPPLEAMASGAPVVVSSATSLPEVVGDAGLLVPPDDPERWVEALRRVLEDHALAERLRRDGLSRAARFTWRETARRTRAVYAAVAA